MCDQQEGGDDDQLTHLNRRIAQNATSGKRFNVSEPSDVWRENVTPGLPERSPNGPLSNASHHALISAHGRADTNALSRSGKRCCWSSHCMARLGRCRCDGADQALPFRQRDCLRAGGNSSRTRSRRFAGAASTGHSGGRCGAGRREGSPGSCRRRAGAGSRAGNGWRAVRSGAGR